MKKTLFVILIVLIAVSAGVGGAYAVSRGITGNQETDELQAGDEDFPCQGVGQQNPACRWQDKAKFPPGRMKKDWQQPGGRVWMGPGMMGRGVFDEDAEQQGERITLEEAFSAAQAYAGELGGNLRVSEVMEFSGNFYAAVMEEDTGKGALELLVDPYTGRVMQEPGPTRMWNNKYGHMRVDENTANALSREQAAAAAQTYLDEALSGAVVDADGIEFYGYYSFDYKLDGKVVGMLSVNGTSGRVWPHTWHGTFVNEKEFDE